MPEPYHIRWMIRRDFPEVFSIERLSFEYPWCFDDFIVVNRRRNCVAMVVEYKEIVIGYFIYELFKRTIDVMNFAVDPDFRRRGVGLAMVDKLKSKLSSQRRSAILLRVDEFNGTAQRFFAAMGFRATDVLTDYFYVNGRDAYLFEYRHKDAKTEGVASIP